MRKATDLSNEGAKDCEIREFEDHYFAKKVKAFDSEKMYARNEARRGSVSDHPF